MIALFYVIYISRNNSLNQYYLPFLFGTGIVVALVLQEGALGSAYNKKLNSTVPFIYILYLYAKIQ